MRTGTDLSLRALEAVVGRLFRAGIVVSASALVGGLVLALAHNSLASPVLLFGLIVLMAIPALRVLIASVDAIRRRDGLLVAATLAVIVELIWLFAAKR